MEVTTKDIFKGKLRIDDEFDEDGDIFVEIDTDGMNIICLSREELILVQTHINKLLEIKEE